MCWPTSATGKLRWTAVSIQILGCSTNMSDQHPGLSWQLFSSNSGALSRSQTLSSNKTHSVNSCLVSRASSSSNSSTCSSSSLSLRVRVKCHSQSSSESDSSQNPLVCWLIERRSRKGREKKQKRCRRAEHPELKINAAICACASKKTIKWALIRKSFCCDKENFQRHFQQKWIPPKLTKTCFSIQANQSQKQWWSNERWLLLVFLWSINSSSTTIDDCSQFKCATVLTISNPI